jgi:hypothetical protein
MTSPTMNPTSSILRLALGGLLGLAVIVGALAPARAFAQSASEVAAARSLFEEGVAAASASRWADALSAFERSYAIAPRSTTLLNLAGAQVQLGQLVAASESYQRLIREAGRNARERRLREQAEEALEALTPRIAHLTLRIDALAASDEVRIDGETVAHAIVGVATPVDPGAHRVAVRRGEREVGRASTSLGEGERGELTVIVPSIDDEPVATGFDDSEGHAEVPDAALEASTETTEGGGGEDIAASPILWTIVGVVVVGGVVAAVVATQVPTSPSYYMGNLGDGQIRF